VYFGAVNYRARIYLNGEALGEHEGGFTPFDLEVTKLLHNGDNFLVVEPAISAGTTRFRLCIRTGGITAVSRAM